MVKPEQNTQPPKTEDKPKWEFTEDFDIGVAPPEAPAIQQRSTGLPFAAKFFTPARDAALEGKKPHKFIPKAFFLDRAAKPGKVDGAYMKGKVRDQFNKWKKAQPQAIQDSLALLMIERTGKEEGFPEAGLSVWIITADKKA